MPRSRSRHQSPSRPSLSRALRCTLSEYGRPYGAAGWREVWWQAQASRCARAALMVAATTEAHSLCSRSCVRASPPLHHHSTHGSLSSLGSQCTHCYFRARCRQRLEHGRHRPTSRSRAARHAAAGKGGSESRRPTGWCRPCGTPLPVVGPPTPAAPHARTSVLQPPTDVCSPRSGEQ